MTPQTPINFGKDILMEPVGSFVTCSPNTDAKDQDWLVYCPTPDDEIQTWISLYNLGYVLDSEKVYDDQQFSSFRKGDMNYIVTQKMPFYTGFLMARDLCKGLNLMKKEDRIMVHKAFINGELPKFYEEGEEIAF